MGDNKTFKKIIKFIKSHQQWLGFGLIVIALFFAYFTVLFEPKHVLLDLSYAIFSIFLIIGLYHSFKSEKSELKNFKFDFIEGFFVAAGVIASYSIVHNFETSSVLASSLVGLIGFLLFRKYQVAIYCGSFAGMVSVLLFNYYEVLILALICAFIYLLTKPLFKGYGGKLGTIAFMSSLITFSIFNEEYLEVVVEFNFWILLVTSVLGVMVTYCIHHKGKTSSVFASALSSSVFGIIIILLFPQYVEYTVVFFSASFIGMSSKERLPNLYSVLISGIVLGLIYFIFVEYFHGLGGKLGLMALMSVMITTGVSKFFKLKTN